MQFAVSKAVVPITQNDPGLTWPTEPLTHNPSLCCLMCHMLITSLANSLASLITMLFESKILSKCASNYICLWTVWTVFSSVLFATDFSKMVLSLFQELGRFHKIFHSLRLFCSGFWFSLNLGFLIHSICWFSNPVGFVEESWKYWCNALVHFTLWFCTCKAAS